MKRRIFRVLVLACWLAGSWVAGLQAAPSPDIRVVIDVSGSMKQNDPHNLRAPALKLLVGLLPAGSRAGVWTFGRYVNMDVRPGPVDEAWKRRARQAAGRLHSRGLFTNIEEALARASYNWHRPDPRSRRHLILLTDGKVDVSGDAAADRASRQRILQRLLPRLQEAGVRVHTIALSAGVDRDLLTRLSAGSGGWYEQVNSAAELQRVFLRLFEKTAPRDALPIAANRFRVDANVQDMTLLVFRRDGGPSLKLHPPGGGVWQAATAPGRVSWFEEQGYDLITVKRPAAGEWRLETQADPDNRVMVATNLRLQLNALPEVIIGDEPVAVFAHLEQDSEPVKRRDFLKLVDFAMHLQAGKPPGNGREAALQDSGEAPDRAAGDGIYSARLQAIGDAGTAAGEQELSVRAASATFQRERRHRFRWYPTLLQITPQRDASGRITLIQARPETAVLDPASIRLEIHRPGAAPQVMSPHGELWQAELKPGPQASLSIRLRAKRYTGQDVAREYPLPPVHSGAAKSGATAEGRPHSATGESAAGPEADPASDPGSDPASDRASDPATEQVDWMMLVGITVMINLFLLANGLLTRLYLNKRRARREAREVADLTL